VTYAADTLRTVRATLAAVDTHYPTQTRGKLLTVTNPKVNREAVERGYLPAIMHLAPHTMAGANLCPWASADCSAACLNTAGRGGIGIDASGWNTIQAARIRRAARMILNPDAFAIDLAREIGRHAIRAHKLGLVPCVRLNGTSDVAFHRIMPSVIIAAREAGVTLYDYTKRPKPDAADHGIDVTYSYPGGNGEAARRYLNAGHRVAVVFATRKRDRLPAEWIAPWGDAYPIIDGDTHDLRFLDPGGIIVGLRAKGKATRVKPSPLGFVQDPDTMRRIVAA
jgi:hypothetical protein